MNSRLQRIIAPLLPHIGFGVALVVLVLAIILFSYIFIIGALIGLVIFAVASVRSYFIRKRYLNQYQLQQTVWQSYFEQDDKSTKRGRTYDQQDL